MSPRTIAITGATGLIGSALTRHFQLQGDRVLQFTRTGQSSNTTIAWNPATGSIDSAQLSGVDAVIHMAGAGIGDKRWTDDYKKEILDSRVKGTKLLAQAMSETHDGPKVLLSGSAIGIYGESLTTEFNEQSAVGTGFLADVCAQWESATENASRAGIRVAHLRTGIVLSPQGGALAKLLPLFKLGAGGKMGSGKQWQSWISIDDEVAAIDYLLTANVTGAVNLTAPKPVTQGEFSKILAKVLHRPSFLPVPSFGPKLLLGGELADALLFTGQKVMPEVLQKSGYTFLHSDLETALRSLLNKPS